MLKLNSQYNTCSFSKRAMMKKIEKVLHMIGRLYQHYEPAISLTFSNPWELLVATVLSAQSRDERVNLVTKALFLKFPDVKAFSEAPLESIEESISSINYFHTKAKHLKETAIRIVDKFQGKVPDTMEELTTLPGVARKTANVVLNIAFNQSVGIVVDTHVLRLSNRLGLIRTMNRDKAEQDLMKCIPKKDWIAISLLLIHHGRAQCTAKNPSCTVCHLNDLCPSFPLKG